MVHLLLGFPVLLSLVGYKNKAVRIFSFIWLFLFAALRYSFGNDYSGYHRWYTYIKNGGASPYDGEPLFTLLNAVSPSYFLLVAFTSAVFVFVVYRLAERELNDFSFALAVFVFCINPYIFLMNLSAIRQSLATAVFIIAVEYAIKRKPIHYAALIIIASLFHKSALILFPIYFIVAPKKIKPKTVKIIILLVLTAILFLDIKRISGIVAVPLGGGEYLHHISEGIGNSLRATVLTSIYFVYLIFNFNKTDGKMAAYSKIYFVAVICGVLAYRVSAFTRIQMYFDVFSVVTLPYLFVKNTEQKIIACGDVPTKSVIFGVINKYVLPCLIVIIYLLRYYSFFTNPDWSSFHSYRSLFELL